MSGENPGNFFIGPDFKLGEGTDGAKFQTTGVVAGNPIGAGYVVEAISDMGEKVVLVKQTDDNGKPVYTAIYPPKGAAQVEEHYQLGKKAEEQLKRDAAEFAKQVDRYQAKKMNWHESFTVMQTPLVLQISDSRVKPLPVVMSQSTLSKIFTKHNLSLPMVKQLPAALADPIMVLESEGSRDKRKKGLSLCWN